MHAIEDPVSHRASLTFDDGGAVHEQLVLHGHDECGIRDRHSRLDLRPLAVDVVRHGQGRAVDTKDDAPCLVQLVSKVEHLPGDPRRGEPLARLCAVLFYDGRFPAGDSGGDDRRPVVDVQEAQHELLGSASHVAPLNRVQTVHLGDLSEHILPQLGVRQPE